MAGFAEEMIGPYRLNTIVIGDCLEVMARMPDGCVDLVVTDPPYPGLKGNLSYKSSGGVAQVKHTTVTVGEPWDVTLDWMEEAWRVSKYGMMCFCSFHNITDFRMALSKADVIGLITWYIRNCAPMWRNVPKHNTQFIWLFQKQTGLTWSNLKTSLFDIPKPAAGCLAKERILIPGTGKAAHPTQKPIALLLELLKVGGDLIFDPFMGSGTTAVAADRLGRKFFGCDINSDYVEMALKRLEKDRSARQLEFDLDFSNSTKILEEKEQPNLF